MPPAATPPAGRVPPLHAPIRWLFIDVGGPLLDDTPLLEAYYRFITRALMERGLAVDEARVQAARRRHIEAGTPSVHKATLFELAGDEEAAGEVLRAFRTWLRPRQADLNPPQPGVRDALAELSRRYRLALCANQGTQIHEILRGYGLREYFSAAAISGEVGLEKPDPRLFRHLLGETGARPGEVVMVGDSPGNDILPARALGMRTVRILTGPDSDPDSPIEADGTVPALRELPALLAQWESSGPGGE